MADIAGALAIANCKSAALVGSGGKTTLLWHLSAYLRLLPGVRTLVTTTTKIGEPPAAQYDQFVAADALAGFVPPPGLTLSGARIAGKKLAGPTLESLELARCNFDHILFEADGAHERPLKGWAPYEPVVPAWTEMTVGVMPLWPLGRAASPDLIHRFPAFARLSGAGVGEPLTTAHLASAVAGGEGLFAKARGQRILFLSVSGDLLDDKNTMDAAENLLRHIGRDFLQILSLVLAGDARTGACRVLWHV